MDVGTLGYSRSRPSHFERVRRRWRAWALLVIPVLYVGSFIASAKIFQGIRAISSPGRTAPVPGPCPELIYFSSSLEVNEMGKMVFYPILRPLAWLGMAECIDDARGLAGHDFPLARWLVARATQH
jgi:hypothetical protein